MLGPHSHEDVTRREMFKSEATADPRNRAPRAPVRAPPGAVGTGLPGSALSYICTNSRPFRLEADIYFYADEILKSV